MSRDTHFGQIRQKSAFLAEKLFITQIPSIPGVFFTIPGDLEITRHFWRLPEIPGDLAGLRIYCLHSQGYSPQCETSITTSPTCIHSDINSTSQRSIQTRCKKNYCIISTTIYHVLFHTDAWMITAFCSPTLGTPETTANHVTEIKHY